MRPTHTDQINHILHHLKAFQQIAIQQLIEWPLCILRFRLFSISRETGNEMNEQFIVDDGCVILVGHDCFA
jgi:hypothetical protein